MTYSQFTQIFKNTTNYAIFTASYEAQLMGLIIKKLFFQEIAK